MIGAPTVQEAVATFVAAYREDHDLTLDQIARRARLFGAQWSASTVGNIERGAAAPTLSTLLYLAQALGSLTDHPLGVRDLLGSAKAIRLTAQDSVAFDRSWIDDVLGGAPVVATPDDLAEVVIRRDKTVDVVSLAEERAADRLRIDTAELRRLSLVLWGHPLEEEARARAGEGSSPQKRGRATRELVEELRGAIADRR